MVSPFLSRVQDGGSRLVQPGYGRPNVALAQYEDAKNRRLAISSLLSQNNNAMWDRQQQQRQFAADLAQRQAEFGGELEINQRRQLLAEAEAEANALLRGRSSEIDNRRMNLAERAPDQIDILRERARLEGSGVGESGLSSHNKQMHTLATTKLLEGQVAELREAMSEAPLTPDGQRAWGDIAGELRVLESQRDTMRPELYNQAMSKLLQKAERQNVRSMVKPPPTLNEMIESNYDPEMGVAVEYDTAGRPKFRPIKPLSFDKEQQQLERDKFEWEKEKDGGSSKGLKSISDMSMEKREELEEKAIESIMNRRTLQAEKTGLPPSEEMDPDEVFKEMRMIFERKRRLQNLISPPEPGPSQAEQWYGGLESPTRVPGYQMKPSEDAIPSPSDLPRKSLREPAPAGPTPYTQWHDQQDSPRRVPDKYMDSRKGRDFTKSPGTMTPDETKAVEQLLAMDPRKRVEVLKEQHPETRGKSIEEIINQPESRAAYEDAVAQGLLPDGDYERHVIDMVDDFLIDATGVFKHKEAFVGMKADDVLNPVARKMVMSLPRHKSLEEAKKSNERYFVDPEGVIRRLF